MRKTLAGLVLAVSCLMLPAAATDAAAAVATIIDRIVAAYGGKDALQKAGAYMMEGKISAAQGREASFSRLFSRPRNLAVVINYEAVSETRYLNGDKGWRSDKEGKLPPVSGMQLDAMVLQAVRADLPWILLQNHAQVTLDKTSLKDGSEAYLLGYQINATLSLSATVDPKTYLIIQSEGRLKAMQGDTAFLNVFGDFRKVDGVVFPFKEINYAAGVQTGVTVIEKITLNPPLNDKSFRP